MYVRIFTLLSGYTLIIVLNRNVMRSAAHPCATDTRDGVLRALCNNTNVPEVPQDLDASTKYLDLSDNRRMKNLDENSFKKYQALTYLSLRNCYIEADIAKGFSYLGFKSLVNLEELDISGIQHRGEHKYDWPNKIKILKVNHSGIGDLVASDMPDLEYVDASGNLKIITFPLFDPKASVKTVILNDVCLDHLSVTQIAPNCHIKRLDMYVDFEGGSTLLEPNKYCECHNIIRWIKQFHIESNLVKSDEGLKCRKRGEKKTYNELCPRDDTYNEALNIRKQCLKVEKPGMPWFLIFGGILILLLISMICVIIILDIRILAHIRSAHAAITGNSTDTPDSSEEETQLEDTSQADSSSLKPTQPEEPSKLIDQWMKTKRI